jgi:hypothetical protein
VTITRLRQAKAALEREGSAEAAWLAGVIEEYEAKAADGVTLDRAAQLIPRAGRRAWWAVEARRARDAALRKAWTEHFGSLGIGEAAREIARLCRRPIRGHSHPLADAVKTGAPLPSSGRRVRAILADAGHELPPIHFTGVPSTCDGKDEGSHVTSVADWC